MENYPYIKISPDVMTTRADHIYPAGFLVFFYKSTNDSYIRTIEGIILDNDGKYYGAWGFPQNLKVPKFYAVGAFRNRTLLLITQEEGEMSWKILTATLPKFNSDGKKK
jgi:hypothetical protein